jgi:hypothetical protein
MSHRGSCLHDHTSPLRAHLNSLCSAKRSAACALGAEHSCVYTRWSVLTINIKLVRRGNILCDEGVICTYIWLTSYDFNEYDVGVLLHVCPADLIRWQNNKRQRFLFQVLDRLFSPAYCDSESLRIICPWSCVVRVQVRALFPLHLCGNKERGGNEVGTTASEHPVTMTAQ